MTDTSSEETPQDIHIHHHFHHGPKGRRPGGPGSRGVGGGPSKGRHGTHRAVIRAFGALRRRRPISSEDFALVLDHQRNLEQRLADLSDLVAAIERDGLVETGEADE